MNLQYLLCGVWESVVDRCTFRCPESECRREDHLNRSAQSAGTDSELPHVCRVPKDCYECKKDASRLVVVLTPSLEYLFVPVVGSGQLRSGRGCISRAADENCVRACVRVSVCLCVQFASAVSTASDQLTRGCFTEICELSRKVL